MSSITQYFSIPSSANARWLKQDEFLFLSTESGVNQIWKGSLLTGEKKQLTFFSDRVLSLYTSPDKELIFFTMDCKGNEQEQIYQLNAATGEVKAHTCNDKARYQIGGLLPDKKTLLYSSNERNPANFDICRMDLETGSTSILVENPDNYNMPAGLSSDGRYFLYNKLKGQSDNCLWMLDMVTGETERVHREGSYAQYLSPVFTPDNRGFYLLTDFDSEYVYLAYYDLTHRKLEKVYEESWDLERIALCRDGRYLAVLINRDGYSSLEIMEVKSRSFINIPRPPKGVMGYYYLDWSLSGHKLLFTITSGKRPAGVWLLDMDEDQVKRLSHASMQGIGQEELTEPELCRYTTFDGLVIPYWFYCKDRLQDKQPGPVIINIHGGPEAQERPMFSALDAYLANQGFCIAAPNVRGSVGYGKHYHHLDDVEKRMDSVKDIEALVKHLVEEGKADPKRIAVMGGSYGGFMTLASITEYPQLWAAAVDIVGISNFETFLTNTSKYRRAHRESEYGSLEEHRDILRAFSPIHKVERIVAPLMVIHGANDPRVPVSEAEQIVNSLKCRGVPVKYLCYQDEGHGLSKKKNQLDCFLQVAEFLKTYLGLKEEQRGELNGE